jgi:hypothetical protein
MREDQLSWGNDPNLLVLKIQDATITPTADIHKGVITSGFMIKMPRYSLDNVLCQLLDDYSEETIINRIKSL